MHFGCHCLPGTLWVKQCFFLTHEFARTHSMSGNPDRLSGVAAVAWSVVTLTAWQASSGTPDFKQHRGKSAGPIVVRPLHPFFLRSTAYSLASVNHIAATYARSAKQLLDERAIRSSVTTTTCNDKTFFARA
jgi:hypothetical protein